MATKKIRVYELARELGLSNAETLDLCERLKVGVKSHSSSIVDAQADRVRRLADQEGLRRTPEELAAIEAAAAEVAAQQKAATAKPKSTKAKAAAEPVPDVVVEPVTVATEEPTVIEPQVIAERVEEVPAEREVAAVGASAVSPGVDLDLDHETDEDPAGESSVRRIRSTTDGRTVVRSGGGSVAPERPALRRVAPPPPPASAPSSMPAPPSRAPIVDLPTPVARPEPESVAPAARTGDVRAPEVAPPPQVAPPGAPQPAPHPGPAPGRGMGPLSGRQIPPPPGKLVSPITGKPIPPPPGLGGRSIPPPSRGRPGGPSDGRPGGPRPATGGPGGGMRTGGPRPPMGGPGAGRGGPGGGPGSGLSGPGGGPGGPGGRGRGAPPQRRKKKKRRGRGDDLEPQAQTLTSANAPVPEGDIVVPKGITCQELAPKLNRFTADLVRILFDAGEFVSGTQSLSDEMIELIAEELGANVILVEPGSEEEHELMKLFGDDEEEDDDDEDLQPRPPVITIMGHVDHGKTKLLDAIRHANVVASEAGGITQHIGAYQAHRGEKLITFIDTPGHAAFTQMRARGAQATDIAVLVVAADDGVMPQTVEALHHARAAEVPIVVAVNKVDKEQADPSRVRQQLSEHGLIPEEWGGDTMFIDVSALADLGIDDLLDSLLLVAEVEELGADPTAPAKGSVLEGHLDVGRGPVATALVQRGTLRVGDPVVAGAAWGRVRAMLDEHGERVTEAGPSKPVQVLGFNEVPSAGDDIRVAPDEKVARTVAEARARRRRHAELIGSVAVQTGAGTKLEDIFAQIQRGEVATLNLIVKADVQGSLEAITESLRKLEREDVRLAFVHRAVGGITENDVTLAMASNATIIGFNVRPDRISRELAEREKVEVRLYEVIYELLEEVERAMLGLLAPELEEVVTGEAEVREVFSIPRIGKVAGCYVRNGTITRGSKVRFLRDGVIIWKGEISSLRRFKDDVREVQSGYECGIGLENYQDLHAGDIIETFSVKEVART